MQKITPFPWFDSQAEEAARFYTSIFQELEGRSFDPATRSRLRPPSPCYQILTRSSGLT